MNEFTAMEWNEFFKLLLQIFMLGFLVVILIWMARFDADEEDEE